MSKDYAGFPIINHVRLARETPDEPMSLNYRSHPTTDEEDRWLTAASLLVASLFAVFATFAIALFGTSLLTPWAIVAAAAFAVFAVIWMIIKGYRPIYALLLGSGILVLPIAVAALGYIATYTVVALLLFGVAVLATARLADKVATHYVAWLLADPRLSEANIRAWRQAWSKRYIPFWKPKPSGEDTADEPPQNPSLSSYGMALFLTPIIASAFVLLTLIPYISLLGFAISVPLTLLGCFLLVCAPRSKRPSVKTVLHGVINWFTYRPGTQSPPGVFRSPAGTLPRRIALSLLIVFALSFSSLRLVRFFPVAVEIFPDSWAELFQGLTNKDSPQSATGMLYMRSDFEKHKLPDFHQPTRRDGESRDDWIARVEAAKHRLWGEWANDNIRDYTRSEPTGWVFLAMDGMTTAKAEFAGALVLSFVLCLTFPIFVFLAALALPLFVVAGKVAPLIEEASRSAPKEELWHHYAERLRNSPNSLEGEHLWLGVHTYDDYPVLLHRNILGEHAHILGDTGSGKTALGVAPLLVQLIRRADRPVIVLDLKGDNALFQAASQEAKRAGLTFKHFTNELGRSTYTFNPFLQSVGEMLSLNQVCENMLEALNLNHGEGYGRSYFSRVARQWLSRVLRQHPNVKSFTELHELVVKRGSFSDPKDLQDAFELISVIEVLAAMDQLNITPQHRSSSSPVLENAIHMPTVLRENQVVYFWLPSAIEAASVREIAKLALYALLSASYQHIREHGTAKASHLVIDEFQRIASSNFKIILEQARSFGIAALLSNQTASDLATPDVDLRPTVQTNTRFKQCFSATDLNQQETLMTASGEALDFRSGYSENTSTGAVTASFTEYTRPRLQRNDVIRASDDPFQSIAQIHRGSGYSQLSGFSIPVTGSHMITQEEYLRRNSAAWPTREPGTILVMNPALKTFETPEERIESGKRFTNVKVSEGEIDFGAELKMLHNQQLREMGVLANSADGQSPRATPSS